MRVRREDQRTGPEQRNAPTSGEGEPIIDQYPGGTGFRMSFRMTFDEQVRWIHPVGATRLFFVMSDRRRGWPREGVGAGVIGC